MKERQGSLDKGKHNSTFWVEYENCGLEWWKIRLEVVWAWILEGFEWQDEKYRF